MTKRCRTDASASAVVGRHVMMAIVFTGCVTLAGCDEHPGPAREMTIVARGMAFSLDGQPDDANPTLRMKPGERIQLTLRNDAPGLLHQFEIPEWDVATDQIRAGESAHVLFTVPESTGSVEYRCRPHPKLMRGVVEVAP